MIAAVVAGGALSVAGATGYAFADADAEGATVRSPGLLSGNLVQLPVHAPVNVCGNTVNVVGLLNPAAGNTCVNEGRHTGPAPHGSSKPEPRPAGGAVAQGSGKDSPGVLSGNGIQLPVDVPVNVSGNSVNVVGIGNPATGNTSVNTTEPGRSGAKPPQPHRPVQQPKPPAERPVTPPAPERPGPVLAHTGADAVGLAVPAGAALLLGGAVLYRRFRPAGR
ncbi:DUF320 domain-containing protein [Streptomyces bambusae]|uniref:chaplin n=1 Tax=Streptomyces bambusae TaxID=1550616 RepID=UPI001CFEA35B|nr:DUF320 domain-containing protein [Streptomyces bambusae]